MYYIILDMEWNQPFSRESSIYKKVGDKLKREIIQIGAVKIDEQMNSCGEFLMDVKPLYYTKLHPHVKRLTKITFAQLSAAPTFVEAMRDFREWCGTDCIFITWGNEDVPNLLENLLFFQIENDWVQKWYNLQPMFSWQMKCEFRQTALKTAVEKMNIPEVLDYHNAFNDAYYTGEIFKRTNIEEGVIAYEKDLLSRRNPFTSVFTTTRYGNFKTIQQAFKSLDVIRFVCPACGKILNRKKSWVYQNKGKYISLFRCKNKDEYLMRLNFHKNKNGSWRVNKVTRTATEEDKTLYKEKLKIFRERQAARKSAVTRKESAIDLPKTNTKQI